MGGRIQTKGIGEYMEDRILVVDDEKNIADPIGYALKREGHVVDIAYDGEEAVEKIKSFKPDILILDVMMPGLNGYDVMRSLEKKNNLGVIMLTAKSDIVDKVLGLELGADDYITKPFDMRELLARVNSLLRRLEKSSDGEETDVITIKDLKMFIKQRKVIAKGKVLDLTPKEFDLLALLVSRLERVYTRDELLDMVWGMEYAGGTRTVDIHIQRLRRKLGKNIQDILQTVHGIGYKAIREYYED